jgi:hypothetical protein
MIEPLYEKKKRTWKVPLLVSGLIVGIATYGYMTFGKEYVSSLTQIPIPIVSEKDEDTHALDDILDDMRMYIDDHPDSANIFLAEGLESVSDIKISKQNYMRMFSYIKEKAEEKPEIVDYLGPNAQKYMQEKAFEGALDKIDNAFYSATDNLKKYGEPLKDAFNEIREFVLKNLEDE